MLCMLESMIVNTTTGVNEMLCMLESMINEMLCNTQQMALMKCCVCCNQ